MLTAVRRGPASILISASARPLPKSWIKSIISQPLYAKYPRIPTSSPIRPFSNSSSYRQQTAETAAVESEIEEEVSAERPPSDTEIGEATQHGPVTKFRQLGERKMVCDTVVKTLVEDMKLETMTQVQSLTINETLKGGDVYVRILFL